MTNTRFLCERVVLSVVVACVVGLSSPPETEAASVGAAVFVPWPGSHGPSDSAQSGGLAILRQHGSQMVRVPAGAFMMGSSSNEAIDAGVLCAHEPSATTCDESTFGNELGKRLVHLSGFFLDRREVSVADYAACVRAQRCSAPPYERGARRFEQPNLPVTLVTWDDARAFCEFRGARLPTEAEFERAARGPRGRRFPWGDLPNARRANHGRLGLDLTDETDGFAELAPVGSFPSGRTPDGFLDLAGNAAEWVWDRYATQYPEGEASDPEGPEAAVATGARVVRGGSYLSAMAWLRGAARSAALPTDRKPWLGFRCARPERPVPR